jgi:predicted phage terminase large subunit-like protein
MDDVALNPEREKINVEYERKYLLLQAMKRDRGLKDLYLFNKFILKAEKGDDNFVKLGKFHKELCHFVQDRFDRKKLVLVPRSHLKSKLVTIGYSTQRIIQNPKIRILIYSATWQIATDLHMSIQKALRSDAVVELFGDVTIDAPEMRADRTRLKLNDKKEPTITAAGIDNNLVSGHYDLIIMDDVVNRDNVNTADQIQKVITRYKDSLDLLEPGGQMVVVGTRWHDVDLYGWILNPDNNVLSSYDVFIRKAYEGTLLTGDDFVPLWEGKFGLEGFRKLLREQGWYHFSAQYMNDPVPEDDATFKRSNFKYWDQDVLRGKTLNRFLLVDPAIAVTKDADFTGMIVVGVDPYGDVYILDIVRRKLAPSQIIDEIFRLRDNWQLIDVGIEMVAYQKALAYALKEDPRYQKRPFHVSELKPNERTKDQRIKGLQPLYENGKIWHNKYHPNNIYLEDELVRFPRSSHDDLIDPLSYLLDLAFPAKEVAKNKGPRRYLY